MDFEYLLISDSSNDSSNYNSKKSHSYLNTSELRSFVYKFFQKDIMLMIVLFFKFLLKMKIITLLIILNLFMYWNIVITITYHQVIFYYKYLDQIKKYY